MKARGSDYMARGRRDVSWVGTCHAMSEWREKQSSWPFRWAQRQGSTSPPSLVGLAPWPLFEDVSSLLVSALLLLLIGALSVLRLYMWRVSLLRRGML